MTKSELRYIYHPANGICYHIAKKSVDYDGLYIHICDGSSAHVRTKKGDRYFGGGQMPLVVDSPPKGWRICKRCNLISTGMAA